MAPTSPRRPDVVSLGGTPPQEVLPCDTSRWAPWMSDGSAWAAWACPSPTPGREVTTPSPSAPSTAPSTWASPSSTPPRSTARTPTRSSSAGPSRAAATGRAGHQVRVHLPRQRRPGHARQHARQHPDRRGGLAPSARHRPHRPLLPAPGRPVHPHRGHRRRTGRAGGRRQGPPHRPVGGLGRDDPPGPCRASRSPRCSRSTRCGRGTPRPTCCRSCRELGHRLRPLLAAGPRVPDRGDPLGGRHRRRRLRARTTRASSASTSSTTCASSTRSRRSPRTSGRRRPRWRWPGSWPRATTSRRSPAPGGSPGWRRTSPPTAVVLSPEQVERLDDLPAPLGDHHNEAQMRMLER